MEAAFYHGLRQDLRNLGYTDDHIEAGLDLLESERVSVMISTPVFMRTMIDHFRFETTDRSSLRFPLRELPSGKCTSKLRMPRTIACTEASVISR